jgi:hypothetical protein
MCRLPGRMSWIINARGACASHRFRGACGGERPSGRRWHRCSYDHGRPPSRSWSPRHMDQLGGRPSCCSTELARIGSSPNRFFMRSPIRRPSSLTCRASAVRRFHPSPIDRRRSRGLRPASSPRTERAVVKRVLDFMETEVAPIIEDYWGRDQFPHEIIPKLRALDVNIAGVGYRGYGSAPEVAGCSRASSLWRWRASTPPSLPSGGFTLACRRGLSICAATRRRSSAGSHR